MARSSRRKPRRLTRRVNRREERQCILIVCEGEKTEPIYFSELKQNFRLSALDIKIEQNGSAAIKVVEHAKRLKQMRINSHTRSAYDQIWCVIDVECPPQSTLNKAIRLAHQNRLQPILSNPCFEYWLLLHFTKTSRPLNTKQVLAELKKHHPDYSKNDRISIRKLLPYLDTAVKHAKELLRERGWEEDLANYNPSTHVFRIVEEIHKDR